MTKFRMLAVLAALTAPAVAHSDAAAGEQGFRQCAACHGIVAPDGTVIQRLSPTGPNLWGIVGRVAGSFDGYTRYSNSIKAAGEAGIVWDEANFVAFVNDQSGFLREVTGDSRARSNMNHKLRGSAEDIYSYLSQFGAQ
jgi:cytochrome c